MRNKMKTLLGICLIMTTLCITACNRQETENSTVVPQATADTTIHGQSATERPIESGAENLISKDEAKNAALKHAEVSEDKAERYESHLEYEDGRQVYEIEFDSNGYEYDYEMDAKTGEILKFDKETK